MTRIAINGFGRIGRNTFKAGFGREGFDIVAVNDLTDTATLAHLLKHDSSYHLFGKEVSSTKNALMVNGVKIPVFAEKDPEALPWRKLGVDIVLECTGRFTDLESAEKHIKAGAKRVIMSAPAKDKGVPTHVMGLNHEDAGKKFKVINNASCTTNCIAPVMAVIDEAFGIKKALMTTIHAYTADQVLQDGPHKDLRRARSAAENIVPTTTGAAKAVTEVMTNLKGKFDGLAIRVPVPVSSLSDITIVTKKKVTIQKVNQTFKNASKQKRWQNILDVSDEPLVSSDFVGNPYSCVVDLALTNVIGGDLLKVVAWYDNEWGYSQRLVDMALVVGKNL